MDTTSTLRTTLLTTALLTAVTAVAPLHAQLYLDANGTTAGAGTPAAVAWDSGTNWTTAAAGDIATVGWTDGQAAIFSAGTEAAGTWAISLAGTVQTNAITFNGTGNTVHNITGGTINMGAGGLTLTSTAAGAPSGRSKTISSSIIGSGGLNLAVNGDTSATGGGSNTIFTVNGTNTFTGNTTITSGVVGYTSNFGDAANSVILNGGGLVFNTTGAFGRNLQIGAAGGVLRNYGSATSTLSGSLSGSGEIRRTDGGTAILTGTTGGFSGALNLQRGTTQIGDGTQTTNLIAGASGITLGDATGGATLRYQLDTSFTHTVPVTFANNGATFVWQGSQLADTLTLNSSLGVNAATGTVRVNSGTLALTSGSDVRAGNLQVASTPSNSATAEVGLLSIGTGASVTTRFFDIGQGSNNAGRVSQTGGTVTIEAGGSGFRLGHWGNGLTPGSTYNLSGGTLDASVTAVNLGWDGEGDMVVGGGAGTATLKGASIQLDANGNSTPDMTLTLSTNGVAEVAGNIASASATDKVILNGGTVRATGNGTWSAPFDLVDLTTSTMDISAGVTTTLSGLVSGTGNLNVTGTGTLVVSGNAISSTGAFTRTGGTLAGGGILTGTVTVNGAISPGTAANAIGLLDIGDAGTTTTLNGNLLMNLEATGDSVNSDLISVFDNVTIGAGAVIYPTFSAMPSAATHKIISYGGTRTGAPTLDPALQIRGLSFAVDTSVTGEVNLNVTGTAAPGNLTWGGDGTGNAWNINSTANWGGQTFYQYDDVTFDDSGNNAANITITGNLIPGSVTIDGTKSYTFSGSGSLVGGAELTKNSTGDLVILNNNTFGTVNLTAGNLIVGNGGTSGSIGDTGGITIADGTVLEFNRSNAVTFNRAATAGSTGTLVKNGTGTLSIGGGFLLLPSNLTINAGTVNVSGGGFSGNRMEGNGQVTVNAGATLVLASGSAHSFGGNNITMTEAFSINGGTLTVNQEQYFNSLTLDGATVNGSSEIRSVSGNNWLVTGTTPTSVASGVNNVNVTNWTVEDVTASTAADLTITGNMGGSGVVKNGIGSLRASGTNNFTGAVTVNAGTYQAGSDRALGFGGAIGNASVQGTTVAAGAALDINGVTVNEVVTLSNGGLLTNSNTTTTGTLSNGLAGVRVVDAGTGYTAAPTIAFSGGGGSGATATTAVSSGALSSVTTTAAGTGYTSAPTVTVTGAGTLATASAQISQLVLTGTGNQIGGAGNLSIPAIMTGSGSYSKVGAGNVTLPTAGSSFTGNVTVESGTLTVTGLSGGTNTGLGANVGTRVITVNGGTLAFGTNNVFGNGGTALANLPALVVNQGATLTTNNYNAVGPVTLNGGTITDSRTTAPGGYQGLEFKGTVTAGGAAASTITAAGTFGHHLVGTITFDVADATAGADLVVATNLRNASADNGSTVSSLTKTGSGTLALNATNVYTGTTTVSAGTLAGTGSVAGPLVVSATGTLAPGASAGNFGAGATTLAGTYACEIDGDNEDTLVVTGNLDLTGATLDVSVLGGGATLPTYVIATYTGTLTGAFATVNGLPAGYSVNYSTPGQVLITNAAGDAFSSWATANGIGGAGGGVDSDGDGIPNGIEFVIGGDPSGPGSNSNHLLPTLAVDGTYLNFVFRRSDESASFDPYVEYGSTLAGWTEAQGGVSGVVIEEVNDAFGAGTDQVTVRIPKALATGSKLFARLRVDIP